MLRTIIDRLLVAALATAAATGAQGQAYPNKPIRAVVPYGIGQATDVMCRTFLEQLRIELKQPVVIENKPGAGGNIGGAEAVKAAPDGYTVLCTGNATHVGNPFLYDSMGFDPDKDLVPVNVIAGTGYVLLVNNKHKGKTLAQILAMAKAAPKPWTVGLASTSAQVVYGLLTDATGIPFVRVPYGSGNRNLFTDLMREDVDLVIEAAPSTMAPIANNQVTPIAVTNPKRTPFLPDTPTLKESGIDVVLVGWNAFYVPKGTSPEIVATLNRAANEALKDGELRKKLGTVASEPMGGSPTDLANLIRTDRAIWEKNIKALGLKAN